MLELDPDLDPMAARHTVDGMATSPRWRLMLPEAVAEALYADERTERCRSVDDAQSIVVLTDERASGPFPGISPR